MRSSFVLVTLLHAFVLTLVSSALLAQSGSLGEPIALSNSSFEDIPRQSNPPRGWYDCGFSSESPVDVHPSMDTAAFFGVDARPFDGNTYLGMVVRDNDTYEAVSQRLIGGPLRAGKCYTFSIYLSRETKYMSQSRRVKDSVVNYSTPAKLRIFGGTSYCNRGEVIAESAPVKNSEWLQYNFRFEPKRDHAFIVLEAYYKTPVLFPYNGNILVDAAGKINPIPCDGEELLEEPLAEASVAKKPVLPPTKPAPRPTPQVPKPITVSNAEETITVAHKPRSEVKLQGLSREELRAGSTVRIEKLFFKADSTSVTPDSRIVLDEIFEFLDANDDVVIEVGGHTNSVPPDAYCNALSKARAESVVSYLVAHGIDKRRLYAKGYGKREPVATNKTVTGRRRNQRVEIKVLSMGG